MTNGRLTVGLGAGGQGWDATVLGQDPWPMAERQDRFAEFVELLDRLLTDDETTFAGRYWRAQDAPMRPGCVQRPRVPFAIAAAGPRAMRVAARHASIWVTNGDRAHDGPPLPAERGAAVVAGQLRRLEQACDAIGRDPSGLNKLVLTGPRLDAGLGRVEDFRAVVDAYESVGATDLVVHWPRRSPPYEGDVAILEELVIR